ncbi:MAG TPA: lysine 5,6-aminomutase subunit alpha, partial [Candidatus Syntrophosphaera sp.]|nr:lysine 5,6-aminomutase subunit alpha [Candidatus Syntrophosphaera sp.]
VKDLGSSLSLAPDSFVNQRANQVLGEAAEFLEGVAAEGLFPAMARGEFADIKRPETGGKGLDGVFRKHENYFNPFLNKMTKELGL